MTIDPDRGKEEFMSMMSHELKTPLSLIKIYSEMLLKSTLSIGSLNEKQKKAVTIIQAFSLACRYLSSSLLPTILRLAISET